MVNFPLLLDKSYILYLRYQEEKYLRYQEEKESNLRQLVATEFTAQPV